jgi:hypothetical protein
MAPVWVQQPAQHAGGFGNTHLAKHSKLSHWQWHNDHVHQSNI